MVMQRLPRRYKQSFRRFNNASDAILNMALEANPSYHTVYTHFLGDALPSPWVAAKTNGAAAGVSVATSQLLLDSGTDSAGYAGQSFGLFWKGDNGIYFTSEQALDTVASSKVEIGLTAKVDDAGAVNVKATPSSTGTNYIVLVRDTTDNAELDIVRRMASGATTAAAEDVYTVAGGTKFVSEFSFQNDICAVFINGQGVGSGAVEGGTLMTPWWFVQARTTSARILAVEWAFITGGSGV